MPKGRTLWEILTAKKDAAELRYCNPMGAKIGSSITIDERVSGDAIFSVAEIREYQRLINDRLFLFADYGLTREPLQSDAKPVRLRVTPKDNPESMAEHPVILLSLWDEFGYAEGFLEVVNDPSKKFVLNEDDTVVGEYWRIYDVGTPYEAEIRIVRDTDLDGSATTGELGHARLDYWDYWRETSDAAGNTCTEFVFVEMDKDSGWFQIWRGDAISPQRIVAFG